MDKRNHEDAEVNHAVQNHADAKMMMMIVNAKNEREPVNARDQNNV